MVTPLKSKVLLLALCLFSLPALAEWKINAGLGTASASDRVNQQGAVVDNRDTSYHYGIGYSYQSNLEFYANWVDLGETSVTYTASVTDPVAYIEENIGQSAILARGLDIGLSYHFYQTEQVQAYAKISAFDWEAETESVAESYRFKKEYDGLDISYGLGVQYQITDTFSSYLEYQRYDLDVNYVNEFRIGISINFR